MLENLTLQELALLNIYVVICLEVLFEKDIFEDKKNNSKPYFLGELLRKIPHISMATILEIQQAEERSLKMEISAK